MLRDDVVAYLKTHLKEFPVEDLRKQLATEGVTEAEFDASLKEALKPVPARPADATKVKARASGALAKVFMATGAAAILGAAVLAVVQKPAATPATEGTPSAAMPAAGGSDAGEGGFVGHYGYVIKLPAGYQAVQTFKGQRNNVEVVHFCKKDTDPTNFLNEGLFGQLGIVRLEVMPSPVADDLHGLENLQSMVTGRANARGEKYTVKNLQVSNLRGIQLTYDVPSPRVESFILGHSSLYSFTAGQDDDVYRALLQSLRDARSEI